MGLFTSACKNCGAYIHWFVTRKRKKILCRKCNKRNNKEELFTNMINYDEVNIIKREFEDRLLYDLEINDYVYDGSPTIKII